MRVPDEPGVSPRSADTVPSPGPTGRRAGWLRRLYMTLRTEHTTPGKVAAGVGLGVFVGCSPFWGLHLAISVLLATLFRLNRVLVYAATNLANPLTAPVLIFAEVQAGHRILHGSWLGLTVREVAEAGVTGIFADFFVGSLLVGTGLALLCALAAYLIGRAGRLPEAYQERVDDVVRRYLDVSIRDAEAARWRLTRDPIFPFLLNDPGFAGAGRILDLGCGRGIVAAILAVPGGGWPPGRRYLGVDAAERYVRAAREALGAPGGPTFQTADLRDLDPPAADLVLLLNVLRYLPPTSQDALLRRLGRALPPGARVVIREMDAEAGWAFRRAAIGSALASLIPGRTHHRPRGYRRGSDLRNALIAAGFDVRDRTTLHATSRGRVLLEAIRRAAIAPRG